MTRLALSWLALSAACSPQRSASEILTICEEQCVADPKTHCVTDVSNPTCTSSAECTSGLTCSTVDAPGACVKPGDHARQCRPAMLDRSVLQTHFGVVGMTINIDASPGITWVAPHGAEVVSCALFSCTPSFKTIGVSPAGRYELQKIDNFEQCVLLFGTVPARQSEFLLQKENIYDAPQQCDDPPPLQVNRVVTDLAAGCWAYDSTRIIAASELVRVSGAMLDVATIPHDQMCKQDGDGCYDAAADRFGVCLAGACQNRCLTVADCPRHGDSQTCDWTCEAVPGSVLGACVPAS